MFLCKNYVLDRNTKQPKKANIKNFPELGIEPAKSHTTVRRVSTRPPRQLNVSIEVKRFNCFNVLGRNINKQR